MRRTDGRSHYFRAFAFGLLAELATIATIIIAVLGYRQFAGRNMSAADYAVFGQRAGELIGLTLGTVFVFLLAWPVVRVVSRHKIWHGVTVATGAIVLQIGGSLAGHHGLPLAYAFAAVLKLAAGGGAGFLAWRVPVKPRKAYENS
jgi:hypothetical protein